MDITPFQFAVAALATYRISLLFTREDGPAHIFRKLRGIPPNKSATHDWLGCFFCFSMTASAFVCGVLWLTGTRLHWGDWFLVWTALSSVAIALHRVFTRDAF